MLSRKRTLIAKRVAQGAPIVLRNILKPSGLSVCILTVIGHSKGQIVELKFFGGLKVEEIAQALEISPVTVMREGTNRLGS